MSLPVSQILSQIAATFTVRDIMVNAEALVRADSRDDAQRQLEQHREFNIIPLPAGGPITAYVSRGEQDEKKVDLSDLISDGTSLLDLPYLMSKRDFFFVLSSDRIAGYIHFSDLNNGLVKLPFFILFEAVERHIWPLVSGNLNEADILKVIENPERVDTLSRRKDRAQKKDVDMGWSGLFNFGEILQFAIHYGFLQISDVDREMLVRMRNRVVHTDKLLVEAHVDTSKLVRTLELCQHILLNM